MGVLIPEGVSPWLLPLGKKGGLLPGLMPPLGPPLPRTGGPPGGNGGLEGNLCIPPGGGVIVEALENFLVTPMLGA